MTIMLSFGKWGGVYFFWGYTKRLCLGWMAITFMLMDIDDLLGREGIGRLSQMRDEP